MKWLLVPIALGFAVARFALPSHDLHGDDVFKDLAHVFVGGLFGGAIVATLRGCPVQDDKPHICLEALLWVLAISLTVLEVLAAVFKV